MDPTPAVHDTRDSETPPWISYDTEMDAMRGASPELVAAVDEYSKKRHTKTGSQTVEEYCRLHEENEAAVRKYRFAQQDDFDEEKARVGRIMHHAEFLRRLRDILPARYHSSSACGLVGLDVWVPGESGGAWKYICAVQMGYTTEYSMLHFDDHGLPLNEKFRGWRTVLLRLILSGAITEQEADARFGAPTLGPVSRRYRQQLYAYRNRSRK